MRERERERARAPLNVSKKNLLCWETKSTRGLCVIENQGSREGAGEVVGACVGAFEAVGASVERRQCVPRNRSISKSIMSFQTLHMAWFAWRPSDLRVSSFSKKVENKARRGSYALRAWA